MLLLLTTLSLLTPSSFAEPNSLADTILARSSFRLSRPTAVRIPVQTCNTSGKVKAVQLRMVEGSLNMESLDAFYAVGGRQRLAASLRLEKNASSGWMALSNQETPCLTRLEMNVKANNVRTSIEVIGRWEN